MTKRGEKKDGRVVELVGTIAIYGTSRTGGGYIASVGKDADRQFFGDGEPRSYWSMNDALWLAAQEIMEKAGIRRGYVLVTMDDAHGQPKAALFKLHDFCYFGELTWGPGVTYTISMNEIMAAAQPAAATI